MLTNLAKCGPASALCCKNEVITGLQAEIQILRMTQREKWQTSAHSAAVLLASWLHRPGIRITVLYESQCLIQRANLASKVSMSLAAQRKLTTGRRVAASADPHNMQINRSSRQESLDKSQLFHQCSALTSGDGRIGMCVLASLGRISSKSPSCSSSARRTQF